jgi:Fe-S-cluster containining protein
VVPKRDHDLIQITNAALADAARRAGEWLVCRKGCTQCCMGAFAINQLDAVRLRHGLQQLESTDPGRAARIRERARQSRARLTPEFPGNPATGILAEDQHSQHRFLNFADDEPCPVLDPETGACDLYEFRPMTCRVFGPPVRTGDEGAMGICELCFHGASTEQIAACEMQVDPENLEPALVKEAETATGVRGNTIIAFCFY